MTREEILAMKPGRELDALVAEHVFGWRKERGPKIDYDGPCESFDVLIPPTIEDPFPLYRLRGPIRPWYFCAPWSKLLAAAWDVVEEFKGFCYLHQSDTWLDGKWEAKLIHQNSREFYGEGETAPEAICKAALLAVMEGEG